jgi:hypothetical protein
MGGVSPSAIQLNFELNLRNYKSHSAFKGEEPWIYPKAKVFKPVVVDKGTFPSLPKLIKQRDIDEGVDDRNKNRDDDEEVRE